MVVLHAHLARKAARIIAAADRHLHALVERNRGTDRDLGKLRRRLADRQMELVAHVTDDVLVELVARHLERARNDGAAQRNDGDVRRAAADVDDHARRRRHDRQAGAERGRRRRFHQIYL